MKFFLFFSFLLFCLSSMAAASEGELILEINNPVTIDGKTIQYSGGSQDRANFKVDGVLEAAKLEQWTDINGVKFYYTAKTDGNNFKGASVVFNYSIGFVCGDGTCSDNENMDVCCTDCGCSGTSECYQNQCFKDIECSDDKSCDDDNACTIDLCAGFPPGCSNNLVEVCSNDDGCCPGSCDDLTDSDCFDPDCTKDVECDDQDESTIDKCVPPGNCEFVKEVVEEAEDSVVEEVIENVSGELLEPILNETSEVVEKEDLRIRWDITIAIVVCFFVGFIVARKWKK